MPVRAHIWHHNGGSGLSRRVERRNPDSLWSFSEDAIGSRGVGLPWGRATGPLPAPLGGGGPPLGRDDLSTVDKPSREESMDDPISRLEVVTREIDRVFGDGHPAAHPELVIAS